MVQRDHAPTGIFVYARVCVQCLRHVHAVFTPSEKGTRADISRQSMHREGRGVEKGREKSVRKAGYLVSLMEGIPDGWGCVHVCVLGGGRPGFIQEEKKTHRLFGIGRRQTIICID